jgi:microcystin-dependent protein
MAEPFIGQLMLVGFNFAPKGWATCDGQLLPISSNTALFSLLGTYYGGNGTSNFQLPDLRGRVPIHQGQGPGLSAYVIGEVAGQENATLVTANLPPHNHSIASVNGDNATSTHPSGAYPASTNGALVYSSGTPDSHLNPAAVSQTGSGVGFSIQQPFLVLNWCIALQGIFPSRN